MARRKPAAPRYGPPKVLLANNFRTEISGNLREISGNLRKYREISGISPDIYRNLRKSPEISGNFVFDVFVLLSLQTEISGNLRDICVLRSGISRNLRKVSGTFLRLPRWDNDLPCRQDEVRRAAQKWQAKTLRCSLLFSSCTAKCSSRAASEETHMSDTDKSSSRRRESRKLRDISVCAY